jgi:hypothetical protein
MLQNHFLTFSEKRNGLTFQKWTFLKCPFSENTRTSLFNVFIIVPTIVGLWVVVGMCTLFGGPLSALEYHDSTHIILYVLFRFKQSFERRHHAVVTI